MTKDVLQPKLWTERPVAETIDVYTDWAATYDAEVSSRGYRTPRRVAQALQAYLPGGDLPILDFGCGTGLSGLALRAEGLGPLHGCDVTQAMLDHAAPRGIYDHLWLSDPAGLDVAVGSYRAIVATGVISLGAAPAETMDMVIGVLSPKQILVMSFNDPTLEHGGYDARLQGHIADGLVREVFREHGPHLDDVDMKSDVIVLEKL